MSELAAFLDQTATVEARYPRTRQDQSGGIDAKDAYRTVTDPDYGRLEDLPCCVRPISARTQLQYSQRNIQVSHRVYFDAPYPVKRGQRLRVNGPVRGDQLILVQGVFDTDELGRVLVVDGEEQLD